MSVIHVRASGEYDVTVQRGLLTRCGELTARAAAPDLCCVVADDKVFPLYGEQVLSSLREAGIEAVSYVFPAGEQSKSSGEFLRLADFLADSRLSRRSCLLALGGGVCGDLCGFTAACYLRGINYIQLPTTLLAAVDSSVGGKTGIDLPQGKNLLGAFHQPAAVLCDPDTLDTLPDSCFSDGMAEVVKYALLGDSELFELLYDWTARQDGASHRQEYLRRQSEDIITRCVTMKRDIVAVDEFDRGERRLLNLGHSFGHAIESCSGYRISHGAAVAIGMSMITAAAAVRGLCAVRLSQRLDELLQRCGLPTDCPFTAEELYPCCLSDKKFSSGRIGLIVPREPGSCEVMNVAAEDLTGWLRDGGAR